VMLNEAKMFRPRPRPGPLGRDRGQNFELNAEADATFLTSRPTARPKL